MSYRPAKQIRKKAHTLKGVLEPSGEITVRASDGRIIKAGLKSAGFEQVDIVDTKKGITVQGSMTIGATAVRGAKNIVDYCVFGSSGKDIVSRGKKGGSVLATGITPAAMIRSVQSGLAIKELDSLQAHLNMPLEMLASKLHISKATLHRRKRHGRLAPEESDRVVRFARLLGKAVEVFESEESARKWLSSPQVGLNGAIPLDYAETEVGAREVEDLLGRIEFGVYS